MCAVHDTTDRTWRHLDFFEHQAYLSARVPRVQCPEHGVHLVNVPWAHPGSGFTLLFEVAMLVAYAKQMPIAPLARVAREHLTAPRWKLPYQDSEGIAKTMTTLA